MSDSTKCMPDDGAVQRIASHDPANLYTSGARTKAMAVEILRLRAELEKAQAEVKRLEGERDKLQDAKVEEWNTKSEPPADVLGEAFEEYMERAGNKDGLEFEQAIYAAVRELAAAFERHVRGGGK